MPVEVPKPGNILVWFGFVLRLLSLLTHIYSIPKCITTILLQIIIRLNFKHSSIDHNRNKLSKQYRRVLFLNTSATYMYCIHGEES